MLQPAQVLEFRVLGPLEVANGDGVVEIAAPKQRALIAMLLLHANEVLSVDRLVDALWGESPPKTAVTSLQNTVSQLRKLLGADVVATKAPGYVLKAEPESLDLARFERLVASARGAEPSQRALLLREALELWRGDPLPELRFEPFADSEIRRLEELRLVVLEQRIEADLEAGRHAELAPELERLVQLHPLRERLRAHLMLALYRSGRQVEALQAYGDARRVLVDELGIEPSPALQQLHAAILRQESRLEGPARRRLGEDHIGDVAKALLEGRLVTVLGEDVSELAAHLASHFEVPAESPELIRVSQYVALMRGPGPLYDELHERFADKSQPASVHRFLASLPPVLRARGVGHQLIVTTSYDLALERAFVEAGEDFDVVAYIAGGRSRGKFCHVRPNGDARVIDEPNTYARELSLEERTVILRLHGQVGTRSEREWESFVVTEDDYIDYLAHAELTSVVPVSLVAKLRRSHFLFLGYVLRDWNLRVVLNRLWGDQSVNYRSWAVQADPAPVDEAFWRQREIAVVDMDPAEYVEALARGIGSLVPLEAA